MVFHYISPYFLIVKSVWVERNAPPKPPSVQLDICGGALHLAIAKHASCAFIRFLLEHGADPNEINKFGLSPVHLAASASAFFGNAGFAQHQNDSAKSHRILRLLCTFHGDLNKKSSRGLIPLSVALISSNNFNCIEYLFGKTRSAALNIVDEWENTCLDRLWYRMNNFKYVNLAQQTNAQLYAEKLKLNTLIKAYQGLLKDMILAGAHAHRFRWIPQKFGYNYFIVSNLIALLRCILVYQRPLVSCDNTYDTSSFKKFLVETFSFLTEKLVIKFTFLVKRRISLYG